MNELQMFSNPEFGQIRTLAIDGEPWVVGKDVAAALGYSNHRKALLDHVDDEDKEVTKCDTPGGPQDTIIINESGLYSLILSSRLPSARTFKRWITNDVLPAIRETGKYGNPRAEELLDFPQATRELTTDDYLEAAKIVVRCGVRKPEIVLRLLWLAGFDIPDIPCVPGRRFSGESSALHHKVERDTTGEAASMINTAIEQYGMTLRGVARLVGLQPTQVNRIRMGESSPTLERSRSICDTLQRVMNQAYAQ